MTFKSKNPKKVKEVRNISEFDEYKKIVTLTKPHSPISILFCTIDFPDEWLIDVVEYRTKSGVITDTYMIIGKDLLEFIVFCKKDGHTKERYEEISQKKQKTLENN